MRIWLVIIGAIIGLPVGAMLGAVLPPLACSLVDMLLGTRTGIVVYVAVFVTVPGGAVLGAVLGGLTFAKRPRLFAVTFIPLVVLLVGILLTPYILREEIPIRRTYSLKVTGQAGKEFVGLLRIDGELSQVKGTLPAEFEYETIDLELAFTLIEPNPGDMIRVRVLVDGHWPFEPNDGVVVSAKYKSFGAGEPMSIGETALHDAVRRRAMPANQDPER